MSAGTSSRRGGAKKLSDLVASVLDPLTARRGHATASLMAGWADIVGPRYAGWTRPQEIRWPRSKDGTNAPALLIVRVDGPRAVLFQHEAGQVLERVNAFFGYAAIGAMRIVQGPIGAAMAAQEAAQGRPLSTDAERKLDATTAAIGDDALREALKRLGRGVLTDTGE